MHQIIEKRFYTVSELADILRVSVSTVRRAVRAGEFAVTRVGTQGQLRIGSEALREYIARQTTGATPPRDRTAGLAETQAPYEAGSVKSFSGTTVAGSKWRLLAGDAIQVLSSLPAKAANTIVTSPPYYWQRDYGVQGQIGHEPSIDGYVTALKRVFLEAKRVLADDGLLFLNLGDTYYSAKGQPHGRDKKHNGRQMARRTLRAVDGPGLGLPRKSLIGIPWRVALALQQDGWTLRSAVIWLRPGNLPEPTAIDRPHRTHEFIFILSKQPRYWFDRQGLGGEEDVWTIRAKPDNPHSHFAPFPDDLVARCLACGCKPGGTVLDPFVGSGTTMLVALQRGHSAIGIDLNREYCTYVKRRIEMLDGRFAA